ncbi:MAG: hypothetical protein AAF399_00245 [Bacteroidota bacterium]
MSFPVFNRSSREYHAPDVYAESQNLTDRKDDYQDAQEANRPETYRDKYRSVFRLVSFYRFIFPVLSGLTLGLLAFLLTLGFEALEGGKTGKDLALGILGFGGLVVVIWINETVKSRTLKAFFKAKALSREVESGTKLLALLTTVLSVVGSAAGIALLTYELTDQSESIQANHSSQMNLISSTFSTDSVNVAGEYNQLIVDARRTIKDNNGKVKALMKEKMRYQGEMVTPWKNRTIAERLEKQNAKLADQIAIWQSDKVKALTAARSRSEEGRADVAISLQGSLATNEETASNDSWIAFIALVLLELVNLFSHFFACMYLARVEKEGIEFGALEPSAEQTVHEIQLSRLSSYMAMIGQQGGYQIGPDSPTPAIPSPSTSRSKAGFPLPWEKPSNDLQTDNEGVLKGVLRGGANGEGGADLSHLDPKTAAQIAGYLEKYRNVVQSVLSGQSNRKTSDSCNVSPSTVQNVKRCMRVANLIPEPNNQ